MTETDAFSGTAFAGCRIIRKIGQGGMGSVYMARHEALDKTVCVKILSPELAREERNVDFFLREARSAAKLEHPNIVQIFNFGQENGSYFIVMSYIEGRSLADVIAEKGPMDTDTATEIVLQVLEGLEHAHSKTIIHRDIKPSNILLGTDGRPRIVDFGLARSVHEEKQLTLTGEMVGTAYFMSPEQGLAGQVDHRADLYSTGATYFYLLTAKYPFDGKSSIEVIHKHIGEPFPDIVLLNHDVPLWVSRVLAHLTCKKPEERYQSAAEAITDIKRLRTAQKDGTSVSNERSIDLPEVSARLSQTMPPLSAAPPPEASLVSDHRIPPAAQPPKTAAAQVQVPKKSTRLQLPELHNSLKLAMHLALTLAGMGCFLLAGSSGTPAAGTPVSLFYPVIANSFSAFLFLALGSALSIWAIFLKPRKFTPIHAFLTAAAAMAAYAGAVYLPTIGTPDTVSKAFLCVGTALKNMISPSNLLIYSLFLFLAASKIVFRPHWALKAGSIAAYVLSLLVTYDYFKAGLPVPPETTYLAVAGAAALAGLLAAVTQKQFSLLLNPPLLFLTANVFIFAMFTTPQIDALTENKVVQETMRVENLRREAYQKYSEELLLQEANIPEYDIEGKPIEKKPVAKPAAIPSVARYELNGAARLEYYKQLAGKLKNSLLDTGGMVLVALFLLLMANIYFVEETLLHNEGLDLRREI
jgi:serine/threonine protein kinase